MGEGASVGLGVIVGEGGNEVAVRGGTVATGAQAINSRNKRKIDFFMPTSDYSFTLRSFTWVNDHPRIKTMWSLVKSYLSYLNIVSKSRTAQEAA